MLLAIYGFRCSEVTQLRLEDIDWENTTLNLRRAKGSKPQKFPLSQTVAEAIIYNLKEVRPKGSSCREVFLCTTAPYRPLSNAAIYRLVSHRLNSLDVSIKHRGPHSLRHACATHLINEGLSLKEISHYLGHQCLETTLIYTKVNLNNLRQVADFNIGDLL
jgi:integrase/recombinase XerD